MLLKEKIENYGIEKLVPFESISLMTSISIEKLEIYKSFKDIFNNIDNIEATEFQRNKLRALKNIIMFANKEDVKKYKINSPWEIYKFFLDEMRFLEKEIFKVVLLNTKNEIIDDLDVSMGTLNLSLVHPREVFKEAIRKSANSIILIHNHPSGSIVPSPEDKNITKRLCESGKIIGIEVLDHIIIGDGMYFSFKENALM